MKVSRDIIIDLLPVYFAKEASQDTVELIEAYFAAHPEFAATVQEDIELTSLNTESITITEENEMQILKKTQRLITIRSIFFPMAIFFTMSLFAFGDVSWSEIEGVHWLWRDYPPGAYICGCIAAASWTGYAWVQRQLRVTGV